MSSGTPFLHLWLLEPRFSSFWHWRWHLLLLSSFVSHCGLSCVWEWNVECMSIVLLWSAFNICGKFACVYSVVFPVWSEILHHRSGGDIIQQGCIASTLRKSLCCLCIQESCFDYKNISLDSWLPSTVIHSGCILASHVIAHPRGKKKGKLAKQVKLNLDLVKKT